MPKQHDSTIIHDLAMLIAVVALVIVILAVKAYGAEAPPKKELPLYGCAWIDCRPDSSGKTSCSGPAYGTTEDLVRIIQENNQGAVSYDCGPGKGAKK